MLDQIKINDLKEMSNIKEPSIVVNKVMGSILLLFGSKGRSWNEAKDWLGHPKRFMKNLLEFDANSVSRKTLLNLIRYTSHA